jgi:outer membrane protein assembly factor BamE (lipoprotein component of BamABCDE complex)
MANLNKHWNNLIGVFALVAVLGLSSCASSDHNMVNYTEMESTILRGKTTQNEVIQLMGSPNLVTKNSKGEEVWTYTKRSYNPETGDVAGGVIVSGGIKPSARGDGTAKSIAKRKKK